MKLERIKHIEQKIVYFLTSDENNLFCYFTVAIYIMVSQKHFNKIKMHWKNLCLILFLSSSYNNELC